MTTLTPLSLPHTLSTTVMDAEIVADATYGALLPSIVHKTGGNFTWTINQADAAFDPAVGTGPRMAGHLWQMEIVNTPGSLWAGHGTPQLFPTGIVEDDPEIPFSVMLPDITTAGASFSAFDVSTQYPAYNEAIMLEWRGLRAPGMPQADRLWVRVLLTTADADAIGVTYQGWFGRERGRSAGVAYWTLPYLHVPSHVPARGGETAYDAAMRHRVLAYSSAFNKNPRQGMHNHPMPAWVDQDILSTEVPIGAIQSDHPAPAQQVQFFAHYCNDADDTASFRRMLYVQTEDVSGYHKAFRYLGYRWSPSGTDPDEASLVTSVRHLPEWHLDFAYKHLEEARRGNDADGNPQRAFLKPEATNHCTYGTKFGTTVGVMTAADDHWWYDASDYYRTWAHANIVPAKGMLTKLQHRTADTSWTKQAPYFTLFVNTFDPDSYNGPAGNLYEAIGDELERMLALLANPHVPLRGWVHLQCFLPSRYDSANKPTSGGRGIQNIDHDQRVDVGVRALAARLQALGVRLTCYGVYGYLEIRDKYHNPLGNSGGWGEEFTTGHAVIDNKGNAANYPFYLQDPGVYTKVLYGGDAAEDVYLGDGPHFWMQRVWLPQWSQTGASGVYNDVMAGTGGVPQYRRGSGRNRSAHGGRGGTDGKLAVLIQQRQKLEQVSWFATHGLKHPDTHWLRSSEAWEEFLSHEVDWGQYGYDHMPGSMLLCDAQMYDDFPPYGAAVPALAEVDHPVAARDPNPPIASVVWREYFELGRFVQPAERSCLATEPLVHSVANPTYDAGRPGLSSTEGVELLCYYRALAWAAGIMANVYDTHIDAYSNFLSQPDAVADPDDVGAECWAFYKLIYQSYREDYAGAFLQYGSMRRPLQVDLLGANTDRVTNPLYAAGQKTNCVVPITTDPPYPPPGATFSYRTLPSFVGKPAEIADATPGYTNHVTRDYETPAVHHGVWADADGALGLTLVNFTDSAADWEAVIDPALYPEIAGMTSYDVDELVIGASANSVAATVLVADGAKTVRCAASGGDFNVGNLPARSLMVLKLTPTP